VTVLRRAAWVLGMPFRWLLLGGITLYRVTLSGWLGGQCRFYPTCSHYAEGAIRTHGAVKGTVLAVWRILRCNPFGKGGVEYVPERRTEDDREIGMYDAVIQRTASTEREVPGGIRG
jgi:putative membrane protein insertion efficiency factor